AGTGVARRATQSGMRQHRFERLGDVAGDLLAQFRIVFGERRLAVRVGGVHLAAVGVEDLGDEVGIVAYAVRGEGGVGRGHHLGGHLCVTTADGDVVSLVHGRFTVVL